MRLLERHLSWVAIVLGLGVALAVGSFISERMADKSPRVIGATVATAGFAAGLLVILLMQQAQRSRLRGYGPRIYIRTDAASLAKRAVVAVAVVYFGLVGFHFVTTGSISAGFSMTATDIKVAAKCPTKPGTIFPFIARSDLESFGLAWASLAGEDILRAVCEDGWPPQ